MKYLAIYAIVAAAALFPAHGAFAQEIYGSQLMTPQERSEYRAKMRAAKTAGEREAVRAEHHDRMGLGGGMGPGGGMGGGGRGR